MPKITNLLKYILITCFVAVTSLFGIIQVYKLAMPEPITKSYVEKSTDNVSNRNMENIILESKTRIQIAGIMEFEITEETSWQTILKLIFTVLVTFFGINLINRIFKKWA